MTNAIYLIIGIVLGCFLVYLVLHQRIKSSGNLKEIQKKYEETNSSLIVVSDRLIRSEELNKSLSFELNNEKSNKVNQAARISAIEVKAEEVNKQYVKQVEEYNNLRSDFKKISDTLNVSQGRIVELEMENKYLKESLVKQKTELEEIGKKFTSEFKLLADQILEDKSKRFTEVNRENLDRILKPLGENLQLFQKQVQDVYEKESKERFSLGEKVKELSELNKTISQEAKNLTDALKGQAKTQGNWGEMILENILEKSGLKKGREYFVQESIRDTEGKRFQPDIIIAYPDNRKVVIDSKVSLVAYERYSSGSTRSEQEKALAEHIKSIRNHIDSLSSKNYPDLVGSLDSVMMFVPIEPAYMVVMEADPEIWNYAYARRVLLISPSNLIAALKLIYNLWQREHQNRNAIEIAERGGQLYDKFVLFVENLKQIGESISKSQKSYEAALGQLSDGKANLIRQAQMLKELGAKAKKTLPEDLIRNDTDIHSLPDSSIK